MTETIDIHERLYAKLGNPGLEPFFEISTDERAVLAMQYGAQMVEIMLQDEPLYQAYLDQTKGFLEQECAQFDRLVAPKRAKQLRRFYKLVKQLDPQTYRDTVDFRTAVGCLEQDVFDQFMASEIAHLEQTLEHGFAFKPEQIYCKICLPWTLLLCHLSTPKSN